MKKRPSLWLVLIAIILNINIAHATNKKYKVSSPDGRTAIYITAGQQLTCQITQDDVDVMDASPISMTLTDGTIWGIAPKVIGSKRHTVNKVIDALFYKQDKVQDQYNDLVLQFARKWNLEVRAYNDGVAYRFVSRRKGKYEIEDEQANYQFAHNPLVTVPYVCDSGTVEAQLFNSFENQYTTKKLTDLDKNRLMILPLTIDASEGKRITITESDLRQYPGMYLTTNIGQHTLNGFFAPLRDKVKAHAGHNNLQVLVESRHNYIAQVNGPRSFPWRAFIVTDNDVDLANTTMSYKLAAPNAIENTSWIKPGKVAWDWWNDWNLEGVGFKPGINNQTYKYYIDFASKQGIEYVILDEGWAVNKIYDLMQVVPEINLKELVDYGKARNVDLILWAGYYAFDRDMEKVCKHYSEMGIKGFKVDFMNGDDQEVVHFHERAAQMAAKYKLVLDFHGTYKPAGLQRTYPNILNFEGVYGLEQMKWESPTCDQVTYEVTIPFIRMISGPMDYTQGAMRNAVRPIDPNTKEVEIQFYPSWTKPMSQGTRCHQLGMYVIYLSPLNMLCDTPTNYEKNPICTEFIASIPTTWDESRTIQGEMGKYIVTARRHGDKWYIGGLNNWDAREITLDLAEITGKTGQAVIFQDGPNADKNGVDYTKKTVAFQQDQSLTIRMAPGGGFALEL